MLCLRRIDFAIFSSLEGICPKASNDIVLGLRFSVDQFIYRIPEGRREQDC
ncbi:hypothetical protein HM1_2195 [Heliomicrobium modesticaldum Ice1]|uniref:Uncharacterized protein n=1 Tax=Heliobacterium modesticaldum (strain ATCC 51547 / Ice1) TaxID=498761 RepID=B0TH76_HELMI|nr:hypothetical protein HM1_2195 [Heliomicrobium modesticaldum Ice1]